MALNDYRQNDKPKQYYPTVYSPYKMSNSESEVDASSLTYTFWNGSLKISIAPRKPGEDIAYDRENAIDIYLNHTKARILYEEICKFQQDPEKYNSSGVPSGQGLITISNGKEFGVDTPLLVIRKIDEQGLPTSSYAYEFKTNYYYSVRNYDQNEGTFDKVTADYNSIEIEQLKTLLLEYYTAMSYAAAYTVIDANRFEQRKVTNDLNSICEKLGVQKTNGAGGTKSSSSVFNNSKPTNYTSASLDDLDYED